MPELPEVETITRGLNNSILNKKINDTTVLEPKIVKSNVPFATLLKNDAFKLVSRHGKYIKINTQNNQKILVHLRMTGQIKIISKEYTPQKHDHLIINFEDDSKLVYTDIRKFGKWLVVPQDKTFDDYINAGVDAMQITEEQLWELIKKHPNVKLKAFLLNQPFIAGIGNIYADEICYDLKLHPETQIKKVNINALNTSIKKILTSAIKNKGTTFSDYRNTSGKKGNNQNYLKAYKQTTCEQCTGTISKIKVAGRTTHFCPNCQIF